MREEINLVNNDFEIELEKEKEYIDKDLSVSVTKDILNRIMDYAKMDLNRERGGILVGTLEENDTKYFVNITDIIFAKKTINRSASLTFTHETWLEIDKEMEENFKDKKIIGWFHSHPGYGVFLSGMDMFIENNFFNLPYQVAYVVDPCNNTEGFFGWEREGNIKKVDNILFVENNK